MHATVPPPAPPAPPAPKKRGPSTPEGKARSAQNARRHGLRAARFVLLPGEDEAAFDDLVRRLVEAHAPEDAFEQELVEGLAAALWRAGRADLMEADLLASLSPDDPQGLHGGDLLARPAHRAGLDTVLRYQAAAQMAAKRAQEMLLRHRKARRAGLLAPAAEEGAGAHQASCTNEFAAANDAAHEAPQVPPAPALRERVQGLPDRSRTGGWPDDLDRAAAVCAQLVPGWPLHGGALDAKSLDGRAGRALAPACRPGGSGA